MQIEELYDLGNWVQREIAERNIVQLYQQLHQVLQQNSLPTQRKRPFENQKNALLKELSEIPMDDLSMGQLEVLEIIGIANNIGERGITKIEDTLFRNVLDVATAAQNVEQQIQELSDGIQWCNQITELLSKIVSEENISEICDQALLRVHFTGEAHLSNITDFKDWGKTWWEIGRGIAMAHNEAPENIRVIGASKGSIILSMATVYAIAKTIAGIIMEALKVAERVLDIKKKAEEVRAMRLANDAAEKSLHDAEDSLRKAAEDEKQNGIEKIIKDTIGKLKINFDGEGDKVTALEGSVRKLVDFIEKGGEIDFVVPEDEEDGENVADEADAERESRKELRAMFKEIRALENKIHQLEDKTPNK